MTIKTNYDAHLISKIRVNRKRKQKKRKKGIHIYVLLSSVLKKLNQCGDFC